MFGISIVKLDLLQFNIFLDINVNSYVIFINYKVLNVYSFSQYKAENKKINMRLRNIDLI